MFRCQKHIDVTELYSMLWSLQAGIQYMVGSLSVNP